MAKRKNNGIAYNLRWESETMHKLAVKAAKTRRQSLNQFVLTAIEELTKKTLTETPAHEGSAA